MVRFNCQDLIETFEVECNHLRQAYLSWIARIPLVKMFLLTKFIYISRAIPDLIPNDSLDKLQAILLKYIWDNKRSRISKNLLFLDAASGGLGVPHLHSYNIATILEQFAIFWDPGSSHRWAQLEDSVLHHSSCKEICISMYFGHNVYFVCCLSPICLNYGSHMQYHAVGFTYPNT